MKKHTFALIAALALALLLTCACVTTPAASPSPKDTSTPATTGTPVPVVTDTTTPASPDVNTASPELTTPQTPSPSNSITAADVENAFVKAYLSVDTVQDYTVNSVEPQDPNTYPDTWLVSYNVLPKGEPDAWMAGNGELGDNGWVVNKSIYVSAVKTDGVVNLTVIGTGL